ncbi:MAG: hypothetical protein ABI707_03440 [Ferruginibacter sp.]
MAKAPITKEIQAEVTAIIDAFNKKTFKGSTDVLYMANFKANFLYPGRKEYELFSPVARLKYTGDINNWEFAIFKWSSETYDPDEWMFPGSNHVNGTIEGAMKAGLAAYPV